jgi:hypothetical protein
MFSENNPKKALKSIENIKKIYEKNEKDLLFY